MEQASRRELAERYNLAEGVFRGWEAAGILPPIGTVSEERYLGRVELAIAAKRGGFSAQRLRGVFDGTEDQKADVNGAPLMVFRSSFPELAPGGEQVRIRRELPHLPPE